MPREVMIQIDREPKPALFDYLRGALWSWSVSWSNGILSTFEHGRAFTEGQARRRAERVARRALSSYSYVLNPGEDF